MDLKTELPPDINASHILKGFQKRCNPPICKRRYPGADCWSGTDPKSCRPFGYQPKEQNPGGLIFYQYQYPFQTQFGEPYSNKGKGWAYYDNTGRMPGSQQDFDY